MQQWREITAWCSRAKIMVKIQSEKEQCWLVRVSFLPSSPSSVSTVSWQNIGINVASFVVSGGNQTPATLNQKDIYWKAHRMKERLKKPPAQTTGPGPFWGSLQQEPQGETESGHCCAISLSPSFPFPKPCPIFSHLLLVLQGQSSGRACPIGSWISSHPLASRK